MSCEDQSNSTGWTVRKYRYIKELVNCSSVSGSTCNINSLSTSHTGVYWCQTESGGRSNPVNITVQDGAVILDSPVHPVTEGRPLTLHCLSRSKKIPDSGVDFYKDDSILQNQTTGEMTISSVSKSDEGLYHCKHPERGESPKSWVSVRLQISAPGFNTVPVAVAVGLSLALLFIILLLILLWKHKSNKGKDRGIQQNSNQTPGQSQSGAEDSQSGNTPLQTGHEAGPSDVTYAELELKPRKKASKKQGKGRELADMMKRRKVDILCVEETRWKGSKAHSIGAGFKLFYYGVDSKRNGVGVVLKEEFVRNVLQVSCELEEKERFWSELDEVMESIPTGERVVIGADFNGHVGEGNTGDEEVMGKFGVKERNLEGQMKLRQALGGQVVLPDDWETTADVIRETGRKVLSVSSGRRKEDKETWWWNEEVQDSIQRKRLAKKKWDMDRTEENRQEYKELQRRVKREVSKAKQKAYDELYTRLDTREGEKDLYILARQRDRDGKDVQQVRVIKDRDERVLTSEESVQRRWKEYFEELMNEENEREKRVEGVNSVEQKVDKIRKDEGRKALKRMKSGKAVGPDDIPVEYRDGQRELHCVFVDLEKVYDRVPREELWYCMRKLGVAEKYVRVVQDMYERSRTVVRCAVVMDQLSEEVRQESPWTMMFADDIVICSESREQVEENLERWRFALERRGMKVSHSKTEYMCVNKREGSGTVRLQGEEVKKVQEFKYLGSTVQSNGECGKEVKKRVQADYVSAESAKAVVTIKPDKHVFRGDTVTLRCEIQGGGDTEWTYSWYKNDYELYREHKTQEFSLRSVRNEDSGSYTCRGWRSSDTQSSEISDAVTLTVSGECVSLSYLVINYNVAETVVSVSPSSWLTEGDSVTLRCEVKHSSTGWTFSWYIFTSYRDSQGFIRYNIELHSNSSRGSGGSYTLSPVTLNHTGVYVCGAERGVFHTEHSKLQPLWITDGDVILDSPVHPVTEGRPLTLHCLFRNKKIPDSGVDFYKDDSILQNQTTGEMTISNVSKSDEGFYHCKHPERGESPKSWVSVRGEKYLFSQSQASMSVLRLISSLVTISVYLLLTVIVAVKCFRAR
ncbi:hypothetical protein QTP70_030475, partial [Hemibagrus guttatus]